MSNKALLSAFQLGPYTLKNRVVMAPLTRNRAGAAQVPQAMNVTYYTQRASAGLIITEASQISPQGMGYPNTPGIHSAEQIAGWQKITQAVHEAGGLIFLQLWHVGRISHPSLQPDNALPVAPSAIKPAGQTVTYEGMQDFVTPRALQEDEIPGLIEDYRRAAQNAMQAGFDGVEVHAANGYLLDQFLRDGTNKRQDGYGGSVPNRMRLLLEVMQAVISVWGADRVGVRLSPVGRFNDMFDSDPKTLFSAVVENLNALKLAYLHVVEKEFSAEVDNAQGFDARELRDVYDGVYMANAGYDQAHAEQAIVQGRADLIAFGKLFIANPDLPQRFAQDADLNAPDPSTFYGGNETGYTDYPSLS